MVSPLRRTLETAVGIFGRPDPRESSEGLESPGALHLATVGGVLPLRRSSIPLHAFWDTSHPLMPLQAAPGDQVEVVGAPDGLVCIHHVVPPPPLTSRPSGTPGTSKERICLLKESQSASPGVRAAWPAVVPDEWTPPLVAVDRERMHIAFCRASGPSIPLPAARLQCAGSA